MHRQRGDVDPLLSDDHLRPRPAGRPIRHNRLALAFQYVHYRGRGLRLSAPNGKPEGSNRRELLRSGEPGVFSLNATQCRLLVTETSNKSPPPKRVATGARRARSGPGAHPAADETARQSPARPDPIRAAPADRLTAPPAAVVDLTLPSAPLSPAMEAYFAKCQEKLGFIPNVLHAYAFDMAKLEAFVAMYNDLMLAPSGLSKLEREMIAVAVSSHNHCYYCLAAHGAAVRTLSGDPVLGELMVMNYRAAALDKRQRGMLDFAVKLTAQPWLIEQADRDNLRSLGFSDRDIWDIAAVAAFFNMSNRLASATDMRPNALYHGQARG